MSQTVVLKVGMSCQGCVGAVKRVLGKLEGVESYDIDIEQQKVTVKGNVQPETVLQTVSKTGKKTAYWEAEAEAKPADVDPKPAESEAKPAETKSKPAETVAAAWKFLPVFHCGCRSVKDLLSVLNRVCFVDCDYSVGSQFVSYNISSGGLLYGLLYE